MEASYDVSTRNPAAHRDPVGRHRFVHMDDGDSANASAQFAGRSG
jgi:hypothetical protein